MFEQTFKNIDDVLWKEAGCATELDYTEQTSWMLFLKYLDDLERTRQTEAELHGKLYTPIIDKAHRWSVWAAPKKKDGSFDHDKALTGDDLIKYVDDELFPYLKGFRSRAEGANTIEYKIGEIFSEIENKFRSGYSLRDALELVDQLSFRSQQEKHELSHLYEAKLRNMGNAGRNGGEYYTPRPLIRAMIQVVKPQIGERIYDGACGSAGFLCEAFEYLTKDRDKLSTKDLNTLQTKTFYAKEKKSLAYVIGIMNMILHGIEAPNIVHTNTLAENISDIQDKDRFDVVLANPPFGGKERPEVQQNFPIKTGETAFLFLQHFIKSLKAGGRAGIVIKNTFLSNTDNASVALRIELLESCNLHTILDMPSGAFQGSGTNTVVLFFEKGAPTRQVWIYKLRPERNLGKTNPLNDDDLKEFVASQTNFLSSENSWSVPITDSASNKRIISLNHPDSAEAGELAAPQNVLAEMASLDGESAEILSAVTEKFLKPTLPTPEVRWYQKRLEEIAEVFTGPFGSLLHKSDYVPGGTPLINPAHIIGGKIVPDLDKAVNPKTLARLSAYRLSKDDVVIGRRGEIGRCAVITDQEAGWLCGTGCFFIRPSKSINADFLAHMLRSHRYRHQLERMSTGATMPNLSNASLSSLMISFPDLRTQEKILERLDDLDALSEELENLYRQKLSKLEDLKQALLQNEFSAKKSATLGEAAE